MTSKNNIPELDRKGLREFGLVTGAIFVALFGLFFPCLLDLNSPTCRTCQCDQDIFFK
jgi:hypothetical protein